MSIYLTGDTHGVFRRIENWCNFTKTTKEDVLMILGDAGINYYGTFSDYDEKKKRRLQELPITLFCVHGNHEQRPQNLPNYKLKEWNGGKVWVEENFPSLLFAKDGEIYDIAGQKTLVIGGAYSVDKYRRLMEYNLGFSRILEWWSDEQPSKEVKKTVEKNLKKMQWNVDVVLSHTCPQKYIPTETFLLGVNQETVDTSTEEWLDKIENKLSYQHWFCGHYHTEKKIDKLQFLFEDYEDFPEAE